MIVTNLLTNMVVLTLWGAIPTNTPQFQDYTFHVLLTNAQALAAKWHLDQTAFATNKISRFQAVPHPSGPTASLVFAGRYSFGTHNGDCIGFSDGNYYSRSVFPTLTNVSDLETVRQQISAVQKEWLRSSNHLTLRKARRVAEDALRSLAIPLELMTVVKAEQMKIKDDTDSKVEADGSITVQRKSHATEQLLPYYEFRWEAKKGLRKVPYMVCNVDVSGITGSIVHFDFIGPHPRLEAPPEYFKMLGLPSNTVFVKRRFTQPPTYELSLPE